VDGGCGELGEVEGGRKVRTGGCEFVRWAHVVFLGTTRQRTRTKVAEGWKDRSDKNEGWGEGGRVERSKG